MDNLKNFHSWEKQTRVVFAKGDARVYLIIEYNMSYGDLITRFQIGDKPHTTTVRVNPAYCSDEPYFLTCQANNGQIGERPFENDSLTWEFLWKPLGLKDVPRSDRPPYSLYTSLNAFANAAKEAGWERMQR